MRDPGLQPERTALAWRRTALSMLVTGALLVRGSLKSDSAVVFAVSVTLVAASLSTFGIAAWRHRVLLHDQAPRALHSVMMVTVVASVVMSAGAGLLSLKAPEECATSIIWNLPCEKPSRGRKSL